MERLWKAWNTETGSRTLVFCCSRRHALFSRDWLRRRGVRVAAVFSGEGGDPRGASLADFVEGKLEALCVVDLFNEGIRHSQGGPRGHAPSDRIKNSYSFNNWDAVSVLARESCG